MRVSKLTHRRIDRFLNPSLTLRGVIFEDTCCHESILPVVFRIALKNYLTLSLPNLAESKFRPNFHISFRESTGRELSLEWSHHRMLSTKSKVRVTLQNSIKHSGSERVNLKLLSITGRKDQIAAPIRFPNLFSTHSLACIADVIQPR